ncbi:MAG: DinB family protein [Candidatus Thorarchaeota archaeon]
MILLKVTSVAIEQGDTGLWYGRIIDLLGTHARAASRIELLSELKAELLFHLQWLRRHREPVEPFDAEDLRVTEEVTGIRELGESGGEVALFEFDRQVVDNRLLRMALRHMEHNRLDLLDVCMNLKDEQLKLIPSGKSRSITDILEHVCNAEEFYISRLGTEADDIYERELGIPVLKADRLPLLDRLNVVRTAAIRTLKELLPSKGESVFQRSEYTDHPEEQWTAFKIIRRFLEHEREHIYNVREYLSLQIRQL